MNKTQILTLINLFCLIALLLLTVFFPFLFAIFVILLVPITIYLIYRMNFIIPIILSVTAITLTLIFKFSILYLLMAILYVFGCLGGVWCIKLKTFGKSVLVTACAILLAFVLIISLSYIFYEKSPVEASYDLIAESENERVYDIAFDYNVNVILQDATYSTQEEKTQKIEEARAYVEGLGKEEVLHNYAVEIRYRAYQNFATYMFGYIITISIVTYLYVSYFTSLFMKEQTLNKKGFFKSNMLPIERSKKVRLPQGYFLGVMIPLLIMFFFRGYNNICTAIYDVIFYDFFTIPFSIFGLYFVLHIKEIEVEDIKFSAFDIVILVLLVLVLNYRILMVFGLIDYMLDLKMLKENYEKIKRNEKGE